ncbi:MAG TPA: class I SAM-dependent methyltransferase [Gemmatimonadales bacterium]|nr:class I SAM-dependent methyltransferase [Gemmatimonadales bacterium]
MSNDEVYASGLLNRALDPATQPPEIRAFMRAEIELLDSLILKGTSVLDVGCGTGRHLGMLSDRLRMGVGVDYERGYILQARRNTRARHVHFVTGDATAIPLRASFEFATCLTNTWGTMSDKLGVLNEMRRLAPRPRTRFISVFAESSVPPRREWYRRLGHAIVDEAATYLASAGGFRSEHFSESRLRSLIGECTIHPLAGVAYAVTF